MNELISIITPAYNSSKYIADTIESVLSQTYDNFELIIIDDASQDDTVNIVEKYKNKDKRIKLFTLTQNGGAAKARNVGVKNSNGRFIAFLDSDDLWKPNKLENQLNFMKDNNFAFSCTSYDIIDENNNYLKTFIVPDKQSYYDLLKTCSVGCLTVMYDVKQLNKQYFPYIRKGQDYALWLQILKQTKYIYGLKDSLSIYRKRKNSISSNKLKAIKYQWEIYRKIEKLNSLKSMYYLIWYIYYGIKKHI